MVRIEEVDPYDDDALAELNEQQVRVAAGQPYGTAWTLLELRVAARTDDPWSSRSRLVARDDDGVIAASCLLDVPLRDNTGTAWAELTIDPSRRASAGALLDELADRVRLLGRRTLEAGATWPAGEPQGPDAELLRVHGFRLGLVEDHRVLDLPADVRVLERLAAGALDHHRAYRFETWADPTPEELVEELAALRSVISVEAPSGEMGWEAEDFTPRRIRAEEDELRAQDRKRWTTVALAADGTVAGHTQLVVPGSDLENAYQWDTLVRGEHRGHRLGLALKVRNLLAAADDLVPRRLLHTWNAQENAPMIAVNEAMGFRLVSHSGEFRREV